ncbi:MAG: hypothetical protein ACK5O7_05240 [Holosporales bacterium]
MTLAPDDVLLARLETLTAQVDFLAGQIKEDKPLSYDPLIQEINTVLMEVGKLTMTSSLLSKITALRTSVDKLMTAVSAQQAQIKSLLHQQEAGHRSARAYQTIANLGRKET